jgi:hypothetical protein
MGPEATQVINIDSNTGTPSPKKKAGAQQAYTGVKFQWLLNAMVAFREARIRKATKVDVMAVHEFNKKVLIDWVNEFGTQVYVHNNNAPEFTVEDEKRLAEEEEVEEVDNHGKPVMRLTRVRVTANIKQVSVPLRLRICYPCVCYKYLLFVFLGFGKLVQVA